MLPVGDCCNKVLRRLARSKPENKRAFVLDGAPAESRSRRVIRMLLIGAVLKNPCRSAFSLSTQIQNANAAAHAEGCCGGFGSSPPVRKPLAATS